MIDLENGVLLNQVEEMVGRKRWSDLRDLLVLMEPADIALVLEALSREQLPLLYRLLPKELAAEVFVEMESEEQELLIPIVALQTVAANLGSMLTPIGNPQNLYLYTAFDLSMGTFLGYMLPLTLLSLLLLAAALFLLGKKPLAPQSLESADAPDGKKLAVYGLLFLVCLACVLRLIPWPVMLFVLILAVILTDRKLFGSVDYFLLLTFVCFFLFIGNAGRIPAVSALIKALLDGRELPAGVMLSQVISNVPAAILLSGFTDKSRALLYGVNIGGLGTLIASLASVISYRLYGNSPAARKGAYLKTFTMYNLIFLAILYGAAMLLLAR